MRSRQRERESWQLMRQFTSSQQAHQKEEKRVKSRQLMQRMMKNDDVPVSDRVERRAHLDDGDVRQESKVFEGLQSFWVTQPLIGNITKSLSKTFNVMGSNHQLPRVSMKFHFLLEFSPRAFVGDLSCSVLFTATIRFSLPHCCSTLNWTISSMNHFGQR